MLYSKQEKQARSYIHSSEPSAYTSDIIVGNYCGGGEETK